MPAYITSADMGLRCDWKLLGDLCSDSPERITPAGLVTNANMVAALNSASGKVDGALLYGDRYASTDLSGLTDNSLALLKDICCQVAVALLYKRKFAAKTDMWKAHWDAAEEQLELLRKGANVFNLPAVQQSATVQASGPSIADYNRSGLASHYPGMQYFPITRPTFNNG